MSTILGCFPCCTSNTFCRHTSMEIPNQASHENEGDEDAYQKADNEAYQKAFKAYQKSD